VRIAIVAIGRMKSGPERELVSRYLDRARAQGRGLGLSGFDVLEAAESRLGSSEQRRADESRFLAQPGTAARRIVLDERGEALGSEALATRIAAWNDAGTPALHALIGGPDGLDPALRREADLVLALSPLTWPHQLVRVMLAEQLYRATTILAGHPYHRGG
jgi:23S rRNA (pseudouridine1915-N3)-methyltransferase